MPKVIITGQAAKEYDAMDKSQSAVFSKHFAKFETSPPRKRLKANSRYLIGEVGQGRIICLESREELYILHVFSTHKEYERWYRGQK